MTLLLRLCPIFLLLLASCSSDVTVVVDKIDLAHGTIVIDGDQQHAFHDSVIRLQLSPGGHTVSLDGGPAQSFFVREGGLLNLGRQDYVAFDLDYEERKKPSMHAEEEDRFGSMDLGRMMQIDAVILVDSFLIMARTREEYPAPHDSTFAKYLPALLASRNGNAIMPTRSERDGEEGIGRHFETNARYDTGDNVQRLKHINRNKLYIEKCWDFDLDTEIPESISVRVEKDPIIRTKNTSSRTALMRAPDFLAVAVESPELFYVREVGPLRKWVRD